MGDIYKKSSLFILTSYYEGMSNALIEAVNMNLPVISTNVSGSKDILMNGKGGKIVKNFSSKELFIAMSEIDSNFSKQLKKLRYAKENLERFCIKKASKTYLDYLYSIL